MVFSSLSFLCVFLPIVFVAYQLLRSMRARNALLICASLLFYAYGEPMLLPLLLVSTVLNYCFGLLVGPGRDLRRMWLAIAVVVNLGLLAVFKYADLFVGTANVLLGINVPLPGLPLPLGISFYTFQALSYVIDVYRGDSDPQRSYPRLLLYISLFPQLVAGPIVKYHDIDGHIGTREGGLAERARGMRRFCIGLAKKVLIANTMGSAADALFSTAHVSGPLVVVAAFSYLMQIYFDFSAYSDMAIGLGHLFGFTFRENFDYPYTSCTIKEFWRRWHISLSTWFRDYLYIPLGGNRLGRARTVVNKVIVFLLCGLWHGASWTFVLWGAIHGLFSLLEEVLPIKKLPRPVGHAYTLIVVALAFVIFRCDTLAQAQVMLSALLTGWGPSRLSLIVLVEQLTPLYLVTAIVAMVGCTPLLSHMRERLANTGVGAARRLDVAGYACSILLLVACLVSLASGTYNPFIYFRF